MTMLKMFLRHTWLLVVAAVLVACGSPPTIQTPAPVPVEKPPAPAALPAAVSSEVPTLPNLQRGTSRWVAVSWSELPGLEADTLFEAWNAWLKSCERPGPDFAPLCAEVRRLSIGTDGEQRQWLMARLQPYRVESLQDQSSGLLTAYYEPEFEARRTLGPGFAVPLFRPPASLNSRKPWFSRQEMETLPEAQAALRGREIAYLADPVQAMLLHIQGSGRLRMTEPDGSQKWVRLAYAANNGQAYQSIGRWLLDQGEVRDASWPGIHAWMLQNPQRVSELMWRNPRVVFFKEETLSDFERGFGPRGAQGVPLTPGRSIAVDPDSIPFGTPVWLASDGPQLSLQRLVLAQDTGSAIRGAVRADYFAGWGAQAGELAGRLKQPLRMWVLWPKTR
ncbi:MAG: membrane-bound lytic murein transglycosylase A [Comamonadaceae bacterium]|nr:MAG: membrane-bound lytic murein transglycosylase A [Comamonadaceae bacterium]